MTSLSFHAAKGLEWPVVHLAGLEEGFADQPRPRADALAEETSPLLRRGHPCRTVVAHHLVPEPHVRRAHDDAGRRRRSSTRCWATGTLAPVARHRRPVARLAETRTGSPLGGGTVSDGGPTFACRVDRVRPTAPRVAAVVASGGGRAARVRAVGRARGSHPGQRSPPAGRIDRAPTRCPGSARSPPSSTAPSSSRSWLTITSTAGRTERPDVRFELFQRFAAPPTTSPRRSPTRGCTRRWPTLPKLGAPGVLDRNRPRATSSTSGCGTASPETCPSAVKAVIDPAKLTWIDDSRHDLARRTVTFTLPPDHYADRFRAGGSLPLRRRAGRRPARPTARRLASSRSRCCWWEPRSSGRSCQVCASTRRRGGDRRPLDRRRRPTGTNHRVAASINRQVLCRRDGVQRHPSSKTGGHRWLHDRAPGGDDSRPGVVRSPRRPAATSRTPASGG